MNKVKTLPILLFLAILFSGCATIMTQETLFRAASEGDVESTLHLINEGFDIDEPGEHGLTPLMTAAKRGDIEIMALLIDNGANLNLKDNFNKTALWYAFDYENYEAYKLLTQRGARRDFSINPKMVASSEAQTQIYKLAKEHSLYRDLKRRTSANNTDKYDIYFSEYPKGLYTPEVRSLFKQKVSKDYKASVKSKNKGRIQSFINRYSGMGQKCYRVTAGVLNIRSGNSTRTKKIGKYKKGDHIYASGAKDGWIKTDMGWISKQYLSRVKNPIPFVSTYISAAKKKAGSIPKKSQKTPEPIKKSPTKKYTGKLEAAEKELDSVIKDSSLTGLETFIKKYKNKKDYNSLVIKAREEYKKILLSD